MIVLIEDILIKGDPDSMTSPYDEVKVMETNRWCEVTRLELISRTPDSPLVKFIGLYADGMKISRTYSASYCWIVKLQPEIEDI